MTLLALNELISEQFEIRFVKASAGGDTLAFLPLTNQDWLELDFAFGTKVDEAFGKLTPGASFFGSESRELPPEQLQQIKRQSRELHFARTQFRLTTKTLEAARRDSAGGGRAHQPVREPLFGDLILQFFHDVKPAFALITEGELDEYDMSREALREIAWKNLQSAFKRLKIMTTEQPGVFEIAGGGDMIACIALHERMWDAVEKERGPVIAAFVRRDRVLFVSAADKIAIAALGATAKALDPRAPKALSRELYQRRANGWQVL
jgi:hypothetical protein